MLCFKSDGSNRPCITGTNGSMVGWFVYCGLGQAATTCFSSCEICEPWVVGKMVPRAGQFLTSKWHMGHSVVHELLVLWDSCHEIIIPSFNILTETEDKSDKEKYKSRVE